MDLHKESAGLEEPHRQTALLREQEQPRTDEERPSLLIPALELI